MVLVNRFTSLADNNADDTQYCMIYDNNLIFLYFSLELLFMNNIVILK